MRPTSVITVSILFGALAACEAPTTARDPQAPFAGVQSPGREAPSQDPALSVFPGDPAHPALASAGVVTALAPALAAWFQPVEVHEWGTFTSVQSPEGLDMEGLHHEEEPLPAFVHGRDGLCLGQMAKCLEFIPGGVTQKMETPVIYFHGAAGRPLRVTVDFPLGLISQWYPAADFYSPERGGIASGAVANGSMTWTVALDPEGYAPPPVDPGEIWAPSRRVASLPLRSNGEDENFIFYRGLGAFTLPVRVTSSASGMLTLSNQSLSNQSVSNQAPAQAVAKLGPQVIPAAFVVRVTESGGGIVPLGELAPGRPIAAAEAVPVTGMDTFLADARKHISAALEASGLDADESLAMVDTWTVSYFHTPGLRVLYVLPRVWTDAILPMSFDFIPSRTVRTLVGRIEVTTETEAAEILAGVEAAYQAGVEVWSLQAEPFAVRLGRHAEAKLRAVRGRVTGPEVGVWLDQVVSWMAGDP